MKARHDMNRFPLMLLALLVLWLGSMPASAMDDGGGRSVFATGAGNRALSMGGAFAAVANDASAPIYNPVGVMASTTLTLPDIFSCVRAVGNSPAATRCASPGWTNIKLTAIRPCPCPVFAATNSLLDTLGISTSNAKKLLPRYFHIAHRSVNGRHPVIFQHISNSVRLIVSHRNP